MKFVEYSKSYSLIKRILFAQELIYYWIMLIEFFWSQVQLRDASDFKYMFDIISNLVPGQIYSSSFLSYYKFYSLKWYNFDCID